MADKHSSGSDNWGDYSSMSFASHEFATPPWAEAGASSESFLLRSVKSFKRDPTKRISRDQHFGADGRSFDSKIAAEATATTMLMRRLKGRHLQMIAFGGSIGEEYNAIWISTNMTDRD